MHVSKKTKFKIFSYKNITLACMPMVLRIEPLFVSELFCLVFKYINPCAVKAPLEMKSL